MNFIMLKKSIMYSSISDLIQGPAQLYEKTSWRETLLKHNLVLKDGFSLQVALTCLFGYDVIVLHINKSSPVGIQTVAMRTNCYLPISEELKRFMTHEVWIVNLSTNIFFPTTLFIINAFWYFSADLLTQVLIHVNTTPWNARLPICGDHYLLCMYYNVKNTTRQHIISFLMYSNTLFKKRYIGSTIKNIFSSLVSHYHYYVIVETRNESKMSTIIWKYNM